MRNSKKSNQKAIVPIKRETASKKRMPLEPDLGGYYLKGTSKYF